MAIVLETNARNAACNAVTGLLNSGTIEFQSSTNVVIATVALAATAFAAAANGAASMNAVASAAATAAGTVAKAVFKTSGGVAVFTATVATTGADINLSSTTYAVGDNLQVNSYSHTQPA